MTKSKKSKKMTKNDNGFYVVIGKCKKMSVNDYNTLNESLRKLFNKYHFKSDKVRIFLKASPYKSYGSIDVNQSKKIVRVKGMRNFELNSKVLFCKPKYNELYNMLLELAIELKNKTCKIENLKEWNSTTDNSKEKEIIEF